MPDRAGEAARILLDHWSRGTRLAALPEDVRPTTREEGYAIQAALAARVTSAPLFGWKIAATSLAGQAHVRVDGPLAGRILAERVVPDGATVSLAHSGMRCVEVEFAFRLGATLAPRAGGYAVDEVMAAVATLHPAIELPDSRYVDFCAVGAPQLIADDACADSFMLGAAAPDGWQALDLAAHPVSAVVNGEHEHHGAGRNVLGDPRTALTWLVNEVGALGLAVEAGEVVTTGTCVVPIDVHPGDEVRASLGALGALTVRLA